MPHISLTGVFHVDNMTILMILHIAAVIIAFMILVAVRSNKDHIGLLEALVSVLQDKMDMHEETTQQINPGDGPPK